jgi:hypothetical protein
MRSILAHRQVKVYRAVKYQRSGKALVVTRQALINCKRQGPASQPRCRAAFQSVRVNRKRGSGCRWNTISRKSEKQPADIKVSGIA